MRETFVLRLGLVPRPRGDFVSTCFSGQDRRIVCDCLQVD